MISPDIPLGRDLYLPAIKIENMFRSCSYPLVNYNTPFFFNLILTTKALGEKSVQVACQRRLWYPYKLLAPPVGWRCSGTNLTTVGVRVLRYKPLASISLMHISTTWGMRVFCAFTRVVRSTPNIRLTYFMSGMQSFGTFSEHFLCALKPQSERARKNKVLFWTDFTINGEGLKQSKEVHRISFIFGIKGQLVLLVMWLHQDWVKLLLHLNPYRAGQILPILCCVPSVTKVTLLHFIHTLPSVTKVSATIVLWKFCNFACIFNIVKLL